MRSGSNRWGGARADAGRPASGPIASEPHKQRPPLSPQHPVHVIARLAAKAHGRSSARARSARRGATSASTGGRRELLTALRRALRRSLARGDFRIVALVVRKRRLELVVEADSALALARGMQGFQVAAAKHWNRARGRTGTVFPDRYRPRTLRTRAEVRAALATVGVRSRVAWPATYLLRIELPTGVLPARLADPDP